MPYHEAEIRAQKQAVEYQLNAQVRFREEGEHNGRHKGLV